MAISPVCDHCKKELTQPGAMILSPPDNVNQASVVMKYHICVKCFDELEPSLR